MADATHPPLPWSLQQRLLEELRKTLTEHGKSEALPELLLQGLRSLLRSSKNTALRALVANGVGGRPLLDALEAWVADMPETHRVRYLLDRLTQAGGFRWAPEPPAFEGPIRLPRAERDRITRRFERLWERSIDRVDDAPQASEYADALDEELDRLGRTNETLAARLLRRRFAHRSGEKTLRFRDLLDRRDLADPEAILRVLEKSLDLEWTEPTPSVVTVETRTKPYARTGSFAVGDRVDHPKFGLGLVTAVVAGKVKIQFDDGERTLATQP